MGPIAESSSLPGVSGAIRPLQPDDLAAFRDHLLRLDPETRHNRFAMGATDIFLRRYAEMAFSLDVAAFGYFDGGVLRGVAELRPVTEREAEAAFTVEQDFRGRGIGTALFARVVAGARARRLCKIFMSCLAYNGAMQALARKFAAELVFESRDVLARRDLATRPLRSRREGSLFATAILTVERRWFGLRPR